MQYLAVPRGEFSRGRAPLPVSCRESPTSAVCAPRSDRPPRVAMCRESDSGGPGDLVTMRSENDDKPDLACARPALEGRSPWNASAAPTDAMKRNWPTYVGRIDRCRRSIMQWPRAPTLARVVRFDGRSETGCLMRLGPCVFGNVVLLGGDLLPGIRQFLQGPHPTPVSQRLRHRFTRTGE
jgi:hypothetical protein